jgi:hypothetical protein
VQEGDFGSEGERDGGEARRDGISEKGKKGTSGSLSKTCMDCRGKGKRQAKNPHNKWNPCVFGQRNVKRGKGV